MIRTAFYSASFLGFFGLHVQLKGADATPKLIFQNVYDNMEKIKFDAHQIVVTGIQHNFYDEIIISADQLHDLTIVIFKGDYPPKDIYYNNVIALSNENGQILWRIELDNDLDIRNPYETVVDHGDYLIFNKAKSHRIAVNRRTGEILRNVDLMSGGRPW